MCFDAILGLDVALIPRGDRSFVAGRPASVNAFAVFVTSALQMRSYSVIQPCWKELLSFATNMSQLTPCPDSIVPLPVSAIRFTHHSVNAHLAFGEDHDNNQESIFNLFDWLFRGTFAIEDIDPLHVFLHYDPGGELAFYSRNNRRLVALRCLQSLRGDQVLRVPCHLHNDDDTGLAPDSCYFSSERELIETAKLKSVVIVTQD